MALTTTFNQNEYYWEADHQYWRIHRCPYQRE